MCRSDGLKKRGQGQTMEINREHKQNERNKKTTRHKCEDLKTRTTGAPSVIAMLPVDINEDSTRQVPRQEQQAPPASVGCDSGPSIFAAGGPPG